MKKLISILLPICGAAVLCVTLCAVLCVTPCSAGTIKGQLATATGGAVANSTVTLTLTQPAVIATSGGGGGTGCVPSGFEYEILYIDGSGGCTGDPDFLDYAPILGPLTFTGDGIDAGTVDDGTFTAPEYDFSITENGTSSDPCPACFIVSVIDNVQSGGNILLDAYGATGGAVEIVSNSPEQGNDPGIGYGPPGYALIEGSSDVTGSLTTGTVTINGQPYDDLAGGIYDVGNVAVNACGTSEDGVPAGGESCNVTLTANGLLQSNGYGGNLNLNAYGPTALAGTPGANSGNVNLSAYSSGLAANDGSINLTTYNTGISGPFDDTENDITLFALNHLYLQSADLVSGTAPICPNGPDGALVNDGSCAGGGGGNGSVITASGLTPGSVYYASSGGLALAQADASSTTPGLCIASSATTCVLNGPFSTTGLTAGAAYYLSDATPGALTTTAPTTVGHFVQRFGYGLSSTELVVAPSLDVTGL